MKIQSSRLPQICKEFQDDIANWKSYISKDPILASTYAEDRKQLNIVLEYLKLGKFTSAKNKANSLDTNVREVIPTTVWELLEILG